MRSAALTAALTATLAVSVAAPAPAAACDADEAALRHARIDAHLAAEARRARRWNVGWTIGFAGLAGVQLGAAQAEWIPFRPFDDDARAGLHVGAAKAALAAIGRAALPLKVHRPAPTGDPCADLAAAERALRAAATAERRAFWVNHGASIALSAAGLLVLGLGYDTWREGATSVALGFPVGLLNTYTMPRGSWRAARRGELLGERPSAVTVGVGVARGDGYTGLVLSGAW